MNHGKLSRLFPVNILLCLLSICSHAQDYPDAGMWSTFSLEKSLGDKSYVTFDEELRLRENFTRLNLLYTNVGVGYKPVKGVKVALTYRLIEKWKYEYGHFSFRHRLMFDGSYKLKSGEWAYSFRSRIQAEVRDFNSSETGKIPEWFWRNKFDIKRKAGRFSPYTGVEVRYQIFDPRGPESDRGFHRIRLYAGMDYEIDDVQSIGLYYLVQYEFGVKSPNELYILGLEYSVSL